MVDKVKKELHQVSYYGAPSIPRIVKSNTRNEL